MNSHANVELNKDVESRKLVVLTSSYSSPCTVDAGSIKELTLSYGTGNNWDGRGWYSGRNLF